LSHHLLSGFLEGFHPLGCLFRALGSKLELVFMVVGVVDGEHKKSPAMDDLSPVIGYSGVRVNGPTFDRSLQRNHPTKEFENSRRI